MNIGEMLGDILQVIVDMERRKYRPVTDAGERRLAEIEKRISETIERFEKILEKAGR